MVTGRKRVSILGATGSIGQSTVSVIESHGGMDAYDVVALTGNGNAIRLAEQARALDADVAVVRDESAYPALRDALAGSRTEATAGEAALIEAAGRDADICVSAIAGAAGLAPTMASISAGATLALANKESMVCAGPLVNAAAREAGVAILPVDSEHNAIFQVLDERHRASVERLILTASGGPFRARSLVEMASVTPEQAIAHPNWSMGVAISIDSATMFNKGLELIEAHHLFGFDGPRIEILVHPQSIIHSMVGYKDGSVLAQLGAPDMRTPIAYALGWPERVAAPVPRLDFAATARLDFEAPDETRFPALRIAREALAAGGLAGCALNAAKETAVTAFLAREIGFLDIARVVEEVLQGGAEFGTARSLDDVYEVDFLARRLAREMIANGLAA